jgi:hypothetical protein
MYSVFRQIGEDNTLRVYNIRNLDSNSHIVELPGIPGVYRNKVHPERELQILVQTGFKDKAQAELAVKMFIEIDAMCGIDAYQCGPGVASLRVA